MAFHFRPFLKTLKIRYYGRVVGAWYANHLYLETFLIKIMPKIWICYTSQVHSCKNIIEGAEGTENFMCEETWFSWKFTRTSKYDNVSVTHKILLYKINLIPSYNSDCLFELNFFLYEGSLPKKVLKDLKTTSKTTGLFHKSFVRCSSYNFVWIFLEKYFINFF